MRTVTETGAVERIALYGGAFDPVHHAHLEVARRAMEAAKLDEVRFIPAAQSPLKDHGPRACDGARLEMLRLATGGESRFAVDLLEIERGGVSYSLDTARHFREARPRAELFWIVGADQFRQLDRWHRVEQLAGIICFLVLGRPGHGIAAPPIPGLRYRKVDAPLMEASSSEIRRRCREGKSLNGLVPEAVEAFIRKHHLYSNDPSQPNA